MQRIESFNVVAAQRDPAPHIQLRRAEDDLAIELDAATLLAQYRTRSGDTLLVLDEDCPYEEQLHLALVRGDKIVDHIVIGGWYATGMFEAVGIDEGSLRFSFGDKRVLRLSVEEQSSRKSLPRGARRKGSWFAPRFMTLAFEGETG